MLQGFLRTIRKRGNMKKQYYCNPLNMDYRYQFIEDMRSGEDKISREAADPSMILFQGKYYIFASMTLSVWVFGGYGALGEPPSAGQPAAV